MARLGDFYEEDEDPKELVRLFDDGQPVVTAPPATSDVPEDVAEPPSTDVVYAVEHVPFDVELDALERAIATPELFTRRLRRAGVTESVTHWTARAALIARNRAVAVHLHTQRLARRLGESLDRYAT